MSVDVDDHAPGIFRWRHRLGLPGMTQPVSLGEGNTPLIADARLAAECGVRSVLLKLDTLCPTGSFKDRAVAAATAHALHRGTKGLVCASSGNAAASAAAYGARAGLPTVLLTPSSTPQPKLRAGAVYGAIQVSVPGNYSNAYALATDIEHQLGLTNVTTTYANPYGVIGLRSVGYELAAEAPPEGIDVVVIPTSAGPLVHGVVEGFSDLRDSGFIDRIPRVIAAQPQGCAPIVRAFESEADSVEPWLQIDTMVSGLNDPLRGYAEDGTVTLRSIRTSGGAAIALPDSDIVATQIRLAEEFGVFAEPAAATAVAALEPLKNRGLIEPGETIACLLTGHGMKQPPSTQVNPIVAGDSGDLAITLANLISGA